jgi:DNA-binding PadR family transcriptional regulator
MVIVLHFAGLTLTRCKIAKGAPMRQKLTKQEEEKIPSLSGKEALVLDLLLNKPSTGMYGLELVHASANRLKRGTVYVTLSRMEEKGFVESRQEEPRPDAAGLPRRLYRVSGYGQKVHQAYAQAREAWRMRTLEVGGVF